MGSCSDCDHTCDDAPDQDHSVYRSTSAKEGGCNFCTRHGTLTGIADHPVTVVRAGGGMGLFVRFCDDCARVVAAIFPKAARGGTRRASVDDR